MNIYVLQNLKQCIRVNLQVTPTHWKIHRTRSLWFGRLQPAAIQGSYGIVDTPTELGKHN